MHPILAWVIGATYISYKYGYKCNMLPMPRHYIALTLFVSIASLLSSANGTAGALLAYGSLLAVYLKDQGSKTDCDKINVSGSSSSSSGTPGPKTAPGPATPNPPGMPHPAPGPL